jgi:hypothetical protein
MENWKNRQATTDSASSPSLAQKITICAGLSRLPNYNTRENNNSIEEAG